MPLLRCTRKSHQQTFSWNLDFFQDLLVFSDRTWTRELLDVAGKCVFRAVVCSAVGPWSPALQRENDVRELDLCTHFTLLKPALTSRIFASWARASVASSALRDRRV